MPASQAVTVPPRAPDSAARRAGRQLARTWLAGLLALLPLALTLMALGWIGRLIFDMVGPGSLVGRFFVAIGHPLSGHTGLAYLIGTVALMTAIYVLGVLVQSGLRGPLRALADRTLRRIPLVGSVYSLADRFVGLLDQKPDADIGAMSPVWCFMGGGEGAAVLALLPSPDPIEISGRRYYGVLIPTAPVPIGGALLYVPANWVRPAEISIETLTSIYVSMGITPPPSLR
jgi:uncharacterized membrane protein